CRRHAACRGCHATPPPRPARDPANACICRSRSPRRAWRNPESDRPVGTTECRYRRSCVSRTHQQTMTKADKKRNAKAVGSEWNLTLIVYSHHHRAREITVIAAQPHLYLRDPQQGLDDLFPLGFESTSRNRFAGSAIPIAGVAEFAFDAMQVSVD